MIQPAARTIPVAALSTLVVLLGSLTGCGGSAAAQEQACKDWTTVVDAQEQYKNSFVYLGDPDPERQQIFKDKGSAFTSARDAAKESFAAAAKADSAWVPVQEALLHYTEDLGVTSVDTSSDEATIDAACDRVG